MRAAPIFSRSAWSPPEPSVSALRRAGNPQPGIGSRSLPGRPGSWADPLQVDHGRGGPNVDGSAPPTHFTCGAWGDAFPDAPFWEKLDTGAISSSCLTGSRESYGLQPVLRSWLQAARPARQRRGRCAPGRGRPPITCAHCLLGVVGMSRTSPCAARCSKGSVQGVLRAPAKGEDGLAHTVRTSLLPPPSRSSGAPVRWIMARGRRASGVAAALPLR